MDRTNLQCWNAGRRTCQEIKSQTSQRWPCQDFAEVTNLDSHATKYLAIFGHAPNPIYQECDHLLFHYTRLSSLLVHHVWDIRILQLPEGKGVFLSAYIHGPARGASAKLCYWSRIQLLITHFLHR